ncbi:unnamed protein product, partial [Polarella glacialis]
LAAGTDRRRQGKAKVRFPDGVWSTETTSTGDFPDGVWRTITKTKTSEKLDAVERSGNLNADTKKVLAWWQADAWMETVPDTSTFIFSLLYEILPFCLSVPLCLLAEGRVSATNRNLIYMRGINPLGGVIFQHVITSLPWTILVTWLVARPKEVLYMD